MIHKASTPFIMHTELLKQISESYIIYILYIQEITHIYRFSIYLLTLNTTLRNISRISIVIISIKSRTTQRFGIHSLLFWAFLLTEAPHVHICLEKNTAIVRQDSPGAVLFHLYQVFNSSIIFKPILIPSINPAFSWSLQRVQTAYITSSISFKGFPFMSR